MNREEEFEMSLAAHRAARSLTETVGSASSLAGGIIFILLCFWLLAESYAVIAVVATAAFITLCCALGTISKKAYDVQATATALYQRLQNN